jgi:hypothetical protein
MLERLEIFETGVFIASVGDYSATAYERYVPNAFVPGNKCTFVVELDK